MRKFLVNFFILAVVSALSQAALCQNEAFQMFKVVSLPQNSGYDKATLNKELNTAKTKAAVIKIIKSHKQLLFVPIVIRVKTGDGRLFWWHMDDAKEDKESDFVILQSKANDIRNFYSKNELRKFFKDTIICFDTLKIGAFLRKEDYNAADYFIILDSNSSKVKITLTHDINTYLLFTQKTFNRTGIINANLYNATDTTETIASCIINILDDQTKSSLLDIAEAIKEETPDADIKMVAAYLNSYIKDNYGTASYNDIIHFLSRNK